MRTFFVLFVKFFAHVSTPTTRTTRTKLLLGPLSEGRGQKYDKFYNMMSYKYLATDFERFVDCWYQNRWTIIYTLLPNLENV